MLKFVCNAQLLLHCSKFNKINNNTYPTELMKCNKASFLLLEQSSILAISNDTFFKYVSILIKKCYNVQLLLHYNKFNQITNTVYPTELTKFNKASIFLFLEQSSILAISNDIFFKYVSIWIKIGYNVQLPLRYNKFNQISNNIYPTELMKLNKASFFGHSSNFSEIDLVQQVNLLPPRGSV